MSEYPMGCPLWGTDQKPCGDCGKGKKIDTLPKPVSCHIPPDFNAHEELHKIPVKLICPNGCGWSQIVPYDEWLFQSRYGHGYTCGTGTCPSHTDLVLESDVRAIDDLLILESHIRSLIDEDPHNPYEGGMNYAYRRILKKITVRRETGSWR